MANETSRLWLMYPARLITRPVVYELGKKFEVITNVRQASVTPEFSGTPTGSVVYKDGTKTLKTVTLSGGVASYTTSALTHEAHTITATYNGSASFSGSSASLTQTVN